MSTSDRNSRKRLLQLMGGTALVLSLPSTIFFVLYSVSLTTYHSPICTVSIVAAALDMCTLLSILIFTFHPMYHGQLLPLCGALPFIVGAILSAVTLGWMNVRHDQLPETILGTLRDVMVAAGFAVFITSLIAQTVFWTMILLNASTSSKRFEQEMAESPYQYSASAVNVTFPASAFTTSKASVSLSPADSKRDSKRLSNIGQIFRTKSRERDSTGTQKTVAAPVTDGTANSSPAATIRTPPSELEVNHFDTWDTSDISIKERVAASLAVVEQENMEAAMGLGISTPRGTDLSEYAEAFTPRCIGDHVLRSHAKEVERHNSPPLPENTIATRSITFPKNVALLATTLNSPTFAHGGARHEYAPGEREPWGIEVPGGTGKWLVHSQTMI